MKQLKAFKHAFWDFPVSLIFRPFKSFDALKDQEEGKMSVAITFLCLMGIMSIVEYQYTGFIMNVFDPREMHAILLFVTSVFPILLIVLANWSITTLMDGKATLKEIFLLMSYALFPVILARLTGVIFSNVLIESELIFITVIVSFGWMMTGFTMVIGFVVMHQFTLSKTFLSLLLTLVSLLVIIFVLMLFFSLLQQLSGFFSSLIEELIYRLNR